MATTPKKPQDRLPKKRTDAAPECGLTDDDRFTFTINGVKHVSANTMNDVLTLGMIREHRGQDMEFMLALLDGLFDGQDEANTALNGLPISTATKMFNQLEADIQRRGDAALGE